MTKGRTVIAAEAAIQETQGLVLVSRCDELAYLLAGRPPSWIPALAGMTIRLKKSGMKGADAEPLV